MKAAAPLAASVSVLPSDTPAAMVWPAPPSVQDVPASTSTVPKLVTALDSVPAVAAPDASSSTVVPTVPPWPTRAPVSTAPASRIRRLASVPVNTTASVPMIVPALLTVPEPM